MTAPLDPAFVAAEPPLFDAAGFDRPLAERALAALAKVREAFSCMPALNNVAGTPPWSAGDVRREVNEALDHCWADVLAVLAAGEAET